MECEARLRGLYWIIYSKTINLAEVKHRSRFRLQDDIAGAAQRRREAIAQARANRPRIAQLEREIIQAVIVLYLLILGSFAGLHLYC